MEPQLQSLTTAVSARKSKSNTPSSLKCHVSEFSIEAFVPGEKDANVLDRELFLVISDHHVPRHFEDRGNADDATDSASNGVFSTAE